MINIETYNPPYLSQFPPYSYFDNWIKGQTNQLLGTPATENSLKILEAEIISVLRYYKSTGDIQNEDLFVKYVLIRDELELSICCFSPKIISMAEEVLNYKNGITNITAKEIFAWERSL